MPVYLDNNATTPLRPSVKNGIVAAMDIFGNPSAIHRYGQNAKFILEGARRRLASFLQVRSEQIIFTSGGSESSVMCLKGVLKLVKNPHIVVSKIEHAATYATVKTLKEEGVNVSFLNVTPSGKIDTHHLETLLEKEDVTLVSVQWANNETGVIQPVEDIVRLCKKYHAYCHVDAVQILGKKEMNLKDLSADAVSIAFHKCGGPKGLGALVLKNEIKMSALITGGGQERHRRAGTENTLALGGIEPLIDVLEKNEEELKHLYMLRNLCESSLKKDIPTAVIVGEEEDRLPNTTHVIFKDISSELLVMALDMEGIAVSQGSACSSGRVEPSRILLSMGYSKEEALSAVRISFGWHNTKEDVEKLLNALKKSLSKIKNEEKAY